MRPWTIVPLCAALTLTPAILTEAMARAASGEPQRALVSRPQHSHPPRAVRNRGAELRREARPQRGHASVYASSLAGQRMADGGRFDPRSDTVASRTLPLGSRARVTHLGTGRSTTVQVRDRGPHGRGRILDVSPAVAARLGMAGTGTAPVEVRSLHGQGPGFVGRAEAATPARRAARR